MQYLHCSLTGNRSLDRLVEEVLDAGAQIADKAKRIADDVKAWQGNNE
jgi:hypothetical protein